MEFVLAIKLEKASRHHQKQLNSVISDDCALHNMIYTLTNFLKRINYWSRLYLS